MIQTVIAFLLFTLEWFHIWGHSAILFRIRLLPRKDLVRIRIYFLVDLLSVFVSSILFTGKLRWLACIQMAQHAYYFICWNKTSLAKKIINWSSLDRTLTDLHNKWELDSILGTGFDIVVHLCMAYQLGQYLSTVQVIASLVIVQAGVLVLQYGPYYAWATPGRIPAWIKKRVNTDQIVKEHKEWAGDM